MVVEFFEELLGVFADPAEDQAGGELAGFAAAHAIGDGEDEVVGIEEGFAEGVEGAGAVGADFEGEEGVIVGDMAFALSGERAPGDFPDVGVFDFLVGGVGEEGGEFEVDEAESAHLQVVGDVARCGVVVSDAVVGFEFGEEGVGFFARDVGCGAAAVGGDDVVLLGMRLEEFRDVGAVAFFECFEDDDLIGTACVGIGAAEVLVHVAEDVDADEGADAVLEFFHWGY